MSKYIVNCADVDFKAELEELVELELYTEVAKLMDELINELGVECSISCPVVVNPPKAEEPKHRSMKTECQLKSKAWGRKPRKAQPKVIRIGSQLAFALADAGITSKKLPKGKVVDPPKVGVITEEDVDQILKAIAGK